MAIRSYKTVLSYTHQAMRLARSDKDVVLVEVAPNSPEALGVMPFGSTHCPYHPANKRKEAAQCIIQAREIVVNDMDKGLEQVTARSHKKHFKHASLHLVLCSDRVANALVPEDIPRINGQVPFIQEAGHFHYSALDGTRLPKECPICQNRMNGFGPAGKIWVVRRDSKFLYSWTYLCLRCGCLITIGRWPKNWNGTYLSGNHLGRRHVYDVSDDDLAGVMEL